MLSSGHGRASARLTLRADPIELRRLRRELEQFMIDNDLAPELRENLILVANELATNAIEAAALGSDVIVEVHVDRGEVMLAVENTGPPFTLPPDLALPAQSHPRGRGLALSSRIVDELCAEPSTDGTRIVARILRT
jgi:anti-sigma regulatory factor (Ser/Thr protein kinase)